MKIIEHINGEPRIRSYWAVVFFTTVTVFVTLGVATALWWWLHDTRMAAMSFFFSFPAAWFAAILFLRRKLQKSHVDAA